MGISVYSPHTAVDAAPGGHPDFLADIITGQHVYVYLSQSILRLTNINRAGARSSYSIEVVTPAKDAPLGFDNAGYGRIVRLLEPESLGTILQRIHKSLPNLSGLSVAVPQSIPAGEKQNIQIMSIGICAGSGDSVLGGLVSYVFYLLIS